MPAGRMPRGMLGRRIGGRLIDLALLVGVAAVLRQRVHQDDLGADGLNGLVAFAILYILWLLVGCTAYESLCFGRGSSMGKRVFGLRIATDSGEPPTPRKAVMRGVLMSWPVILSYSLGYLPVLVHYGWLAWDSSRDVLGRHWVDRVSGSVVLPRH